MDQGVALVETIGENFEPQLVIVMTPIAGNSSGPVALALAPAAAESVSAAQVTLAQTETADATTAVSTVADEIAALGIGGGREPLADGIDQPDQPAPEEVAVAVVEAPTSLPTEPVPMATELPPTPDLPTPAPPTPMPQPTLEPTPVPPTATNAPAGVAALASSNDTRSEPTPTWTPAATAGGAVLAFLPTPTAAPEIGGRTAQPIAGTAALTTVGATPTPVAYQVRAGDTLMVIAGRYDVSVEALMAANEIGARDVTRIQPGRMLIIPVPTPTPPPIRLDAPTLSGPEDGVSVACADETKLSWERILYVKDSDKYFLHVGFVSGVNEDGAENVTWVVAQLRPVTTTEWTLDNTLCNLAPQAYDRQWRWWVEVVAEQEGTLVSVSPPSPVWGFRWD